MKDPGEEKPSMEIVLAIITFLRIIVGQRLPEDFPVAYLPASLGDEPPPAPARPRGAAPRASRAPEPALDVRALRRAYAREQRRAAQFERELAGVRESVSAVGRRALAPPAAHRAPAAARAAAPRRGLPAFAGKAAAALALEAAPSAASALPKPAPTPRPAPTAAPTEAPTRPPAMTTAPPTQAPTLPPSPDGMSERQRGALELLAALQREARFLDFIEEEIAGFDDAQVGMALRPMQGQCRHLLRQVFAPAAIAEGEEDEPFTLARGFVPQAYNVVGRVGGTPPLRGILRHRGWRATKADVPAVAAALDARIIAPAELEV